MIFCPSAATPAPPVGVTQSIMFVINVAAPASLS